MTIGAFKKMEAGKFSMMDVYWNEAKKKTT